MLSLLQDMVRHKVHANAALLKAIHQHPPGACDHELLKLMHHILEANRYWFLLTLAQPFDAETEARIPESLDDLIVDFRETHERELEWVSRLQEAELTHSLETPHLPGYNFSILEAAMQICMHSQGHRSQCATRLRSLGGVPPTMDFILWVMQRTAPDWSWFPMS